MCRTGRISSDQGFTLLELLVAMALLAIVFAVVLTALPNLADRLALDQSARRIENTLEQAASVAKSTGSDQIVEFETSTGVPTLVLGEKRVRLDPSVGMKWVAASEVGSNAERSAIAFLATGGSSGGTVELRCGRAATSIVVDWLSGTVRQQAVPDDAR